jgi:hypothetical protein
VPSRRVPRFPVIVGGAAFGPDGRYARLLGAQAWAPDARSAATRLEAAPLPHPVEPHQPVDVLPHLADQEYTMVAKTSAQLVKATCTALEEQFPGIWEPDDGQADSVLDDMADAVGFLAVSLYTDDTTLFTNFVTWTADIRAARGHPVAFLSPALAVLAAELRDFPRASRLLVNASAEVTRHLALLQHDSPAPTDTTFTPRPCV